jgi:hypothetical protein
MTQCGKNFKGLSPTGNVSARIPEHSTPARNWHIRKHGCVGIEKNTPWQTLARTAPPVIVVDSYT